MSRGVIYAWITLFLLARRRRNVKHHYNRLITEILNLRVPGPDIYGTETYVLKSNSIITMPGDALAPNGATPSEGIVLTTKVQHFQSSFFVCLLFLIICVLHAAIQNCQRDVPVLWVLTMWITELIFEMG